jgi:hypothetical protein
MSAVHTPVKTQAGQDELSRRALGLSQRHRTVLLLVDGRRSEQQVIEMARQAGVADGLYAELVSLGLIQVQVPAEAAPGEVDIPLNDSTPPADLDSDSAFDSAQLEAASAFIEEDPGLEAAREVLLRALRIDAPVAGTLTAMKVRRARSRDELEQVVDEVMSRISKPGRYNEAAQVARRAREHLRSSTGVGELADS